MADKGMFTLDEMQTLILALGRGQRHFTEEEIALVADWASDLRVGTALLELALEGRVDLCVVSGEVRVSSPRLEARPQGKGR